MNTSKTNAQITNKSIYGTRKMAKMPNTQRKSKASIIIGIVSFVVLILGAITIIPLIKSTGNAGWAFMYLYITTASVISAANIFGLCIIYFQIHRLWSVIINLALIILSIGSVFLMPILASLS